MKQLNFLLLIFALIFVGCAGKSAKKDVVATQKDTVAIAPADTVATPSIYIAGRESKGDISIAVYWKDGVKTELTDGKFDAVAMGIAILNGDVYVAGYVHNSVACYWKNGELTLLVKNMESSWANSITISGNDVYMTGRKGNNACYWKNGKIVMLTDLPNKQPNEGEHEKEDYYADGIAILGNDIYVVGTSYYFTIGFIEEPCYWKNGIINYLDGYREMANDKSISISGNDVFITGLYENKVCYWKNGKIINLTDKEQSFINEKIFVSGKDVYVLATELIGDFESGIVNKIQLWKNKDLIALESSDNVEAGALFVYGNDVYVAAAQKTAKKEKICFWKNGKKTVIDECQLDSEVKAILVQ